MDSLKLFFAFISAGVFTLTTWAQSPQFPPWDPYPGLFEASHLCQGMHREPELMITCLSFVSTHNWVNREAIILCHEFAITEERLNCIQKLAGVWIDTPSIQHCDTLKASHERLECYQQLGRHYPNKVRMKINPEKGAAYLAQACNQLNVGHFQAKCQELLNPDEYEYIDHEGVRACSKQERESEKLMCYQMLWNRFFMPGEINSCLNLHSSSLIWDCVLAIHWRYWLPN